MKYLPSLFRLDLSNNKITEIDSLHNSKSLFLLDLSNNQIKEIDSLSNLKRMNYLFIFHNPISNLTLDIISPIKMQIYLSFHNSSLINDSINQFKQIYIFGDKNDFNFSNLFNNKLSKRSIKYYESSFLITLNSLYHSNCFQTIDLIKRRIHFNLFLQEQVNQFFLKCQAVLN